MSRQKYPDRHFLFHTGQHFFGAFAVLAIAVAVGFATGNVSPSGSDMLAQTGGTSIPPDLTLGINSATGSASGMTPPQTSPIPPATSLPIEVMFSAQPGPITYCETGRPLTPVFLLVTKSEGGNFILSSDATLLFAFMFFQPF